MEATAIESGQQPEQGLVGLPKMKETIRWPLEQGLLCF